MSAALTVGAVLFDLDGTLLDTAPDMVATLNELRAEERQPLLPYAAARAYVSHGVLGLLHFAFGDLDDTGRDRMQRRFIDIYAGRLAERTRLFDGMDEVLARIEAAGMAWGVVTNKPTRLTEPLLCALGLRGRCACVVCGDTTPHRKPHPAPLLHAMSEIGMAPQQALYVGDAERDIAAGRAAGMLTAAALYGYIPPHEQPAAWAADFQVGKPADLIALLS